MALEVSAGVAESLLALELLFGFCSDRPPGSQELHALVEYADCLTAARVS